MDDIISKGVNETIGEEDNNFLKTWEEVDIFENRGTKLYLSQTSGEAEEIYPIYIRPCKLTIAKL